MKIDRNFDKNRTPIMNSFMRLKERNPHSNIEFVRTIYNTDFSYLLEFRVNGKRLHVFNMNSKER